jgi:hypothetical protein
MGFQDLRKDKNQPTFFELLDRIASALEKIAEVLSDPK